MKKYLFPIFLSSTIGIFMSFILISSYDGLESVALTKNTSTIYYLQRGVYSDKENMLNNMKEFQNYIYNVEDNMYHTYIGITKNKKNAEKIKELYKQKGYDIYVKEKITDNKDFVNVLKQYDNIISKTSDENTIIVICNQILSKYEELIKNEY